jgi:hypothetical protein
MDVGFCIFGRFNLNDELNILDVQASGSDVCGHEHLELSLLETLHGDFSLVLGDISVHDFDILFDFV